jgi:hypothetical protein
VGAVVVVVVAAVAAGVFELGFSCNYICPVTSEISFAS